MLNRHKSIDQLLDHFPRQGIASRGSIEQDRAAGSGFLKPNHSAELLLDLLLLEP